jgi:hypothetical protein
MCTTDGTVLLFEVERRVRWRTGRRIRNLRIDVEPERVILRGQTSTYHVKQLAQHGVLEILPQIRLDNTIEVGNPWDDPPTAA